MEDKHLHTCRICDSHLSVVRKGVFDTRFGINKHFNIYKCNNCALVQNPTNLSDNDFKYIYGTYYNFGGSDNGFYTKLRESFLNSVIYRLWMIIDGDVSFHSLKGEGRLLDIGCNEGRGLKIYQQNGFKTEGLEINEKAAIEARKGRFRVYADLIETFTPEEAYDIIVLSNVLEHSLRPNEMLAHISRMLKPEGQVWISCPNIDSWQRKLFGRYWINWHVPFHIVHFSQKSMTNTLKKTGFEIQKIRQESPALWATLSVIVRLFAKPGRPTKQLRNPFLIAALLILIRIFFFPLLWVGNRLRRGDCLVVVARKVHK